MAEQVLGDVLRRAAAHHALAAEQVRPRSALVAGLAATVLSAHGAHVCLVLGGPHRVVARVGSERGARPCAVRDSLCLVTLRLGHALLVGAAQRHARVRHLPPVTEGGVAAYAGVPLTGPGGHHVGVLCVVDDRPREWSVPDLDLLLALAHLPPID